MQIKITIIEISHVYYHHETIINTSKPDKLQS